MDRVESVVIGAGVIGLAVARALAMAGREVVILEAEEAPAVVEVVEVEKLHQTLKLKLQ